MRSVLRQRPLSTTLFAVGLFYLVVCAVCFQWFGHQVNPDGIAYVSIAQHYLHGHFYEAINAYWSPLLSWISVPFLALGFEPIATMKGVMVICGLLAVLATTALGWYLLRPIRFGRIAACILGIIAAIIIACWALAGPTTPDLLYAALFIALILCLYKQCDSWWWYALVGVLAGLLFLAKAVAILIIAALACCLLLATWKQGRGLRKPLVALAVALVIIAPYVALISAKYGHFTIGSSSNYNLQLIAPQTQGHPMLTRLLPPPHPYSTTAWEDISTVPVGNWQPWQSPGHFAANAGKNMWHTILLVQAASLLCTPLAIGMVALWTRRFRRRRVDATQHVIQPWPLITISAVTATSLIPYILLFVEQRYVYHFLLLLFVGFTAVILHWAQEHRVSIKLTTLALAIFMASWLPQPLLQLWQNRRMDNAFYTDSRSFVGKLPPESRIASSTFASLYFCFYTQTHCYSTLPADTNAAVQQIEQCRITHLLLYPIDHNRLRNNLKLQQEGVATYFDMHLYKVVK